MNSTLIKESIEFVINDCFEQQNRSRDGYKLIYLIKSTGEVWADHLIETGYEALDSSIEKRLSDRGVKLNLYFSLSKSAEEYYPGIRKRLTLINYHSANNFGMPDTMGICYAFVMKQDVSECTL